MRVIPVTEQAFLDDFVSRQTKSQFLQSWLWGEFQQRVGHDAIRLGVEDDGHLVASAQLVGHRAPLGLSFLYAPRGPVVAERLPAEQYREAMRLIVDAAVQEAETKGAAFVRFEPPIATSDQASATIFHAIVAERQAKTMKPVQPKQTLFLDLSTTHDTLLAAAHEKTRYNIRLAEKKGVQVNVANDRIDDFLKLNRQTTKRDRFSSHPDEYYQMMVEALGPSRFLTVYVAEFQRKPVAVHLVVSFGDTATYLHGASSDEHRNVMAPHLLHWREIQDAKAAGRRWFDFWGISDEYPHWAGITRFKRGFGGHELTHLGVFDVPVDTKRYTVYRFLKRFI